MRALRRRRVLTVLLGSLLAGLLALTAAVALSRFGPSAADPGSGAFPDGGPEATGGARPNIVMVLTDDLSMNLLPYLPQVRRLAERGMTFDNSFVANSLCCPSRASLLTGGYPHTTQVLTNGGHNGGWPEFTYRRDDQHTFATSLQDVGYTTALMGKYLNGYFVDPPRSTPRLSVPPGWSEWYVAGGREGYSGFDYTLNENGRLVRYGKRPTDYMTDVLSAKATDFIHRNAGAGRPFLLEVSTFAPHAPYTPAPRHADLYPGLTYPRTTAFDHPGTGTAPTWLRGRPPLTAAEQTSIDAKFRKRAQAMRAVDDLMREVTAALDREGVLDNTYVVFTSDNGYHMGERRLLPGKMTALDTDIRVPLVVAGPGVAPGSRSDAMVATVDLCPTFTELGVGVPTSLVDGRSLVPLLRGENPPDWRTSVLVEHTEVNTDPEIGPDKQAGDQYPPTYEALRLAGELYVEYADGEKEYYDLARDPDELVNRAGELPPQRAARLGAALEAYTACRGTTECTAAGRMATGDEPLPAPAPPPSGPASADPSGSPSGALTASPSGALPASPSGALTASPSGAPSASASGSTSAGVPGAGSPSGSPARTGPLYRAAGRP